jgi:hypothetical protein
MQIAYTHASGRGETNLILNWLAETLAARGVRLCGTVQVDVECESYGRCDMDVRVLPEGPVIRISQSLGAGSEGCRLDPAALEQSVALTEARLAGGADLMIVNKFGKQEAEEGRGFRQVIAEALGQGIPVIVGVNGANVAALETFCAGAAEAVEAEETALMAWVERALAKG